MTETQIARAFIARVERSLEIARQVGRPTWVIQGLEEVLAEAREDFRRGIF